MKAFSWVECDSKSDLTERLEKLTVQSLEWIIEENFNCWGYLTNEQITIPIGYAHCGLNPVGRVEGENIFVGASSLLTGYHKLKKKFTYRMPSVFHEFVRFDAKSFVVCDELGFVGLSYNGKERWTYVDDIVSSYKITGDCIEGKTIEGEAFSYKIPTEAS